ncbi:MAG: YaiI/YqxD family protein [Betaproteobacteria bacterium HGW-Betaproteobacteria-2]|nr:MAG: YaiI/YqxD family protein [Betaproteobacteria bacterium HGW-Betaproteobacteria-2]
MSEKPRIWVDADACPVVIKEILFRAAERTQIETILVANKLLRVPPSPWLRAMQVPGGFDVADDEIVKQIKPGDLVITADIPLAAQVIAKGGHALNPRGEFYSASNIQERLAMRNFMEELRGSGVDISGPSSFSQSDRQAFATELDRFLSRLSKTPSSQDRP